MNKQILEPAKPKDFLKTTELLVMALVAGVSIVTIIVIILLQVILDAPLKREGQLISNSGISRFRGYHGDWLFVCRQLYLQKKT